jgi:hypothetical protein
VKEVFSQWSVNLLVRSLKFGCNLSTLKTRSGGQSRLSHLRTLLACLQRVLYRRLPDMVCGSSLSLALDAVTLKTGMGSAYISMRERERGDTSPTRSWISLKFSGLSTRMRSTSSVRKSRAVRSMRPGSWWRRMGLRSGAQ